MLTRSLVALSGTGQLIIKEEPVPELKLNHSLIKVHCSLISPGTEMQNVVRRRENPDPSQPDVIQGYEIAGEILEVKGDSKGLEPGMRVMAMGANAASHATYDCVPNNLIVPIPDTLAYDDAVYACLAATSLHAVRRTLPQLGEYGAVLGLGIIGNLAAQLCQINGARVIAWEAHPARIEIARECGLQNFANIIESDPAELSRIFSDPYGLEFAILAFGGQTDKAIESLMACMAQSADGHIVGRIVSIGACRLDLMGGARMGNLDIRFASRTGPGYHDPEYELGADYPKGFVPFTTQRNLRELVRLMDEKRLNVAPLTTHRVPLEKYPDMAELLINQPDKALGVVLEMDH